MQEPGALPYRKEPDPVVHRAALPYREIGAFMIELKKLTDPSARVLEFEILTAARWGEVVGARWDEIDVRARLWIIPGDRMKRGCEPRVPSSCAAIAAPERQAPARRDNYIFSGRVRGQPIGSDTPMKPLQKLALRSGSMASAGRCAKGRRSRRTPRVRSPRRRWRTSPGTPPNHPIGEATSLPSVGKS